MPVAQVVAVSEHIAGSDLKSGPYLGSLFLSGELYLSEDLFLSGPSSVEVTDILDFWQSGKVTFTDSDGNSETVAYTVPEDTSPAEDGSGILDLATSLSGTYAAGDMVTVTPTIVERTAWVLQPEGEETLALRVPHSLYDKLPLGIREQGAGEMVSFAMDGTDGIVTDVLGKSPVQDLNSVVVTTSPDGSDPQTWMDENGLNMSMESTSGAQVESVKWWNGGTVKAYVQPIFNVAGLSSVQFLLWDEARVGYAFLELKTPNNNSPSSAYEIRAAVQADGGSVESVGLINGNGGSDFVLDTSAGWQDWSPMFSGWSSNPTGGIYRYQQSGKTVRLAITMPNTGTSNATSKTLSLPVTAKTITNMTWSSSCAYTDNGTASTTPGRGIIASAGTTIGFFTNWTTGAFTASGAASIRECHITYEAA